MNGEDLAAAYLSRNGYSILDRNWRQGRLEVDLICEFSDLIVFVEVKTRRNVCYGGGSGAVNADKRARILAAAQCWLLQNGRWQRPCRFDIVCLYGRGEYFRLEHYQNAFSSTLDSGDACW